MEPLVFPEELLKVDSDYYNVKIEEAVKAINSALRNHKWTPSDRVIKFDLAFILQDTFLYKQGFMDNIKDMYQKAGWKVDNVKLNSTTLTFEFPEISE